MSETRTLKVDYLARVEGEGALYVKIHDGRLDTVQLRIFEPPRFFEGFLRGRDYREAPDITARICGICPIAYISSATAAMEAAAGIEPPGGAIRDLRRLIYCGEWIESHVLHIFMLHAPDFLGYPDAVAMAREHRELVEKGLRMKKIGNELVRVIGGREIHPINMRLGGFYRAPSREALEALRPELEWGLEAAAETVAFAAGLDFPDFRHDHEYISLRHPDEYAITEGRLVSNRGLDAPVAGGYDAHLIETHVRHSTALQSRNRHGQTVVFGPLARYANNHDRFYGRTAALIRRLGLPPAFDNPFKSIIARAVEVHYAFEEALRLIDRYEPPEPAAVAVPPRAATGHGATEAPRGICYQRYTLAEDGTIQDVKIVAPTSVNQAAIEADLAALLSDRLDWEDEALRALAEQAIRNYDPCISCSAHFLRLTVDRD